ncbi:MAG: hypothetical protein HC871_06670, partial [Rhizobiales bacterium]|nr:hypothetical protein [Hyphomicrobiales bacterium]
MSTSSAEISPRRRLRALTMLSLGLLVLTVQASFNLAWAQDANPLALGDEAIYGKSLAALTILLVLAILIENALAVIFNWRVFLTYFSLRGIRTPIMIAVAFVVARLFEIDLVAALMAAYGSPNADSGPVSMFLTALILGGGSSSVNNIMVALGLRERARADAIAPKAPPTTRLG